MAYPEIKVKNVIVTGCSTGIGLSAARMLKHRGWRVAATARKAEDLEMLGKEGFSPIELDISNPESTATAAQKILEMFDGKVGGLVNNAGFGQVGALEDLSRDLLRYQFDVNVIGMQDITNRLLPAMRRQGYGRVVNISSVLGRVSLPFMGAYSATKFAMEGLSNALRVELRNTGIGVSLIEPGPIATAFRENAASRAKTTLDPASVVHLDYYEKEIKRREMQNLSPDPFTQGPEAVAKRIIHALESRRPKTRYKVTIPAYAGAMMARFFPDFLIDWVMARQASKSAK
ncbi:MAG TPA: SDR family NAD(P)-dependent oxidoreductase [Kiritimatiellia bacterium]|nr:SDR family NAD(P)-dependent oxidoreductase [Kiritimatiellia bacterium]